MGIPLPLIIMAAFMMFSFAVAVIWVFKTKGNSLKQTIDPKPDQPHKKSKDSN